MEIIDAVEPEDPPDSIQVETISEPCVLYFPAAFPLVLLLLLLSTPNALLERLGEWILLEL